MNNGTASVTVSGAYIELQVAVLKALPRDIDDETALKLAGDGEGLTTFLAGLKPSEKAELEESKLLSMPADGEEFEVAFNFDAIDPLGLVKAYGYNTKGWKFKGKKLKGTITRRFKWVTVGYQKNLDAVRKALEEHGHVPEGVWLEAIKAKYEHDGQWRGIADPSWVDPDGLRYFPFVRSNGRSGFRWADDAQGERWRWLVVCK